MLKFLLLVMSVLVVNAAVKDPVADQLVAFKEQTQGPVGIITTSSGAPVDKADTISTLNKDLLSNPYFVDTMTHFVRERIPVRAVHLKGAGAFGYFVTTHDISDKCKAEFLSEVGKVTPVAVRLSLGSTERGGSDLAREPRGFAVKFYTKEGNFDIVGSNIPVFEFKDPVLFPPFAHGMRLNPVFDVPDENMAWDVMTLFPESLFSFIIVCSDQGVPDGHRHMPGFSIHTYPLYNAAGELSYGRFGFFPIGGVKWLNSTQAAKIAAEDPDYCGKDLYKAISRGDYPTWELKLQLMSEKDLKNATFDPFDVTKLIPESQFKWIPVGKLVLDRNPTNYFADVEQMAFSPGNLVPGIQPSPSNIFFARSFFYNDAQHHRLGKNFGGIHVNCPYRAKVTTYNRDGSPPVSTNGNPGPNYGPNSFNGPEAQTEKNRPCVPKNHETKADNIAQARDYYTHKILGEERNRVTNNIVNTLCRAANFLQDRAVKLFNLIHTDLGQRITKELRKRKCKR